MFKRGFGRVRAGFCKYRDGMYVFVPTGVSIRSPPT